MTKKQNPKKTKTEITLNREESDELQMFLDRLAVQDPDGGSLDSYLHSLRNALAGRPLLAAALVDKLSRNPNRTGFLTFRALEETIAASAHRRELKQAAYRFVQKGFAAERREEAPQKVVLIQGEVRKAAAHFFRVQGTLWLISALVPETVHGGYSLLTAFLEDDYATFNVRVAESTQKLYRDYLQQLSTHAFGGRAVEIPVWHAANLFFEMLDLWSGGSSHAHMERGRDILQKYRQPERKAYVYDLMPEIEHPERRLSEIETPKLFEDMDLSWLRFSKEELATYHEKIKALDSPVLVVPREVQAERSLDVVRGAADNLCTGKTRDLFRRFFEEQAMYFALSSAAVRAELAWIVSRHLASQSPAGSNPAVFEITLYSLRHHWPSEFSGQPKEEEAPAHERRTESGIILP